MRTASKQIFPSLPALGIDSLTLVKDAMSQCMPQGAGTLKQSLIYFKQGLSDYSVYNLNSFFPPEISIISMASITKRAVSSVFPQFNSEISIPSMFQNILRIQSQKGKTIFCSLHSLPVLI